MTTLAHLWRACALSLASTTSMVSMLAPLASGCAAHSPPPDEPLIDVDDPRARATVGESTVGDAERPQAEADAEAPRSRQVTLSRAEVDRVLNAGQGRFLATFEVKARVEKGAFRGWELVRAPWPGVDLRLGDVVVEVHGRTLEHPLEFNLLWNDLRRASEVVIWVERATERFAIHLAIEQAAPGS